MPRSDRGVGAVPNLTLHAAVPADADFLVDVYLRSMRLAITAARGAWDAERERLQFLGQLDLGGTRIIRRGTEALGFVTCLERGDELEMHTLCIAPEHQRHGLGAEVTRRVIVEAAQSGRPVALSVLKANHSARAFYERLGFVTVGSTEHHHRMRRPH